MEVERKLLQFLTNSVWTRWVVPVLAFTLVLVANTFVFLIVPSEQVMGAVQRIFYFHVGAATSTYLMIGLLFLGSVCFLTFRTRPWDLLAEAAGGIALLLASIVLVSGSIWGHSAWNTWWRWEPRLVSFLVLWLLLFSYVLLRSFTERSERHGAFSAILGIVVAVNVPIAIFSIKLLSHTEQLHPQVVAQQGLRDERYVYALLISIAAVSLFSLWLLLVRFTGGLLAGMRSALLLEASARELAAIGNAGGHMSSKEQHPQNARG